MTERVYKFGIDFAVTGHVCLVIGTMEKGVFQVLDISFWRGKDDEKQY